MSVKRYGEFDGIWYDVDGNLLPADAQVVLASDYDALTETYHKLGVLYQGTQQVCEQRGARIAALEAELAKSQTEVATLAGSYLRMEQELAFQKDLLAKYHAQNCSAPETKP
jgi:hypothetical protein